MRLLDLTLPTPAENLALDEALLEEAEAAVEPTEFLRLWEPPEPMVVVGWSSKIADEVRLDACHARGIPVLRRPSGGAAIVTGPGCLMYAVVLSYQLRPRLRAIDRAHRFVLNTLAEGLKTLGVTAVCQGTSDLVTGDLVTGPMKFSGNSVRCKREYLLYHGTVLYDFPLELIDTCLAMPPRQPDYREGRDHGAFVTNLRLSSESIRRAMITAWGAREPHDPWPAERTARLVTERYGCRVWHEKR